MNLKQKPFHAKPLIVSDFVMPEHTLKEVNIAWHQATHSIPNFTADGFEFKTKPFKTDGYAAYYDSVKDSMRMRHSWFARNITDYFKDEYNIIIHHITPGQREYYGLDKNINGTYWLDKDDNIEAFICCEFNEIAKGRGTQDILEIVRLILHEVAHGLVHFGGREDEIKNNLRTTLGPVHYCDYILKDIKELYNQLDFTPWSLQSFIIAILQTLIPLYEKQIELEEKPELPTETRKQINLERWAEAIKVFEGWFGPGTPGYANGSKSYRNNNPGNLRWSPYEDYSIGGFSHFVDYKTGFKGLIHQLEISVDNRSSVYNADMTLNQFFSIYAPSSDNNYPLTYASSVAQQLGVEPTITIKDLMKE